MTLRMALIAGCLSLSASPAVAADPARPARAEKVHSILKANCHRCHGQDGTIEGAMNFVLDLDKLAARKKVVPGNAPASRLFRRVADGTMPPPGESPRPSLADVATIQQWIEEGAPGVEQAVPRKTMAAAEVRGYILADLEKFERRARRFQRYFTLTHLYNAGLGDDELQTYRNALAKLVNSLSWYPTVRLPEAVDPAKTVLRIDLRWYQWDASIWNRIVNDYPYGVLDDTIGTRAIQVGAAAKLPAIRADWFVASASRAPLYYDVLQLPLNLNELERQLRADALTDIQQERVVRVGFNGSGVSRFNRVLERHDSIHGMYWRTYDFDEPPANLNERSGGVLQPDRRNIFAFPLGPTSVSDNPFQHAGGEIIFALPNGLHAYYIVKADNTRLDKAPVAIVSDPRRPDRAVEAGVSCMSCHVTGILPKADQMRDHLEKNPKAFSRVDVELIRSLYPPKEKSLAKMEEDGKKYTETVAKTGARVSRTEAVSTITQKYEADVDLPSAAAEAGMAPEEFRSRIAESPTLVAHVGALRAAGGTITRSLWVQAFGDVVRELHLGSLFQANLNGPTLADNTGEQDPLENRDGLVNGVTFTPDGRRAYIASGDRSVRIYDVEGRRDLKRLIGHTGSVWAVALSPDGTKLLSGGMDSTVRLWDLETAQERQRYDGHSSLVTAVAFTPNGKWAVSGGLDGVVAVWKAATGQEICRVEKMGFVSAIAVDPKGKFALVAADKRIDLIDVNDGTVRKHFLGHTGSISSLALAGDGTHLVSASDDGMVLVWNIHQDKPVAQLAGHVGSVLGVAVTADGRWIVSAGSDRTVRLWDVKNKREAAVFRKHDGPVVAAVFLSNGTQTLSSGRDANFLPWRVEKFFTAVPPPPPPPKIPDAIPLARP